MQEQNPLCPLVTVITVVYNAFDTIESTILSVLSQTYTNVEYIIVDGGSKDGTTDIINRYQDKISYYISEPDHGIYDAMNKGIKASRGKWINFMNAGDTFYDSKVIEAVMKHGPFLDNVKVLYGDVAMRFVGQSDIIKHLNQVDKKIVAYSLNHQSTFIEGDWMRANLYDTSYRIAADANFFHITYEHGYIFDYIPVVISSYEASEGVSASNQMLMFREFTRIRGVRKYSKLWWKGFIKASLINFIRLLPVSLAEKILNMYVRMRVN